MGLVFTRDLEGRYAVALETRNNLVAASQNISGAQRYLANVQFPYCAPPEVQTLNKVRRKLSEDSSEDMSWTWLWQHSRNLRHNLKWILALRARFMASNLNSQSCYHRTSLHKSLINAIAFK